MRAKFLCRYNVLELVSSLINDLIDNSTPTVCIDLIFISLSLECMFPCELTPVTPAFGIVPNANESI